MAFVARSLENAPSYGSQLFFARHFVHPQQLTEKHRPEITTPPATIKVGALPPGRSMHSPEQIEANPVGAQGFTGPRSGEGLAVFAALPAAYHGRFQTPPSKSAPRSPRVPSLTWPPPAPSLGPEIGFVSSTSPEPCPFRPGPGGSDSWPSPRNWVRSVKFTRAFHSNHAPPPPAPGPRYWVCSVNFTRAPLPTRSPPTPTPGPWLEIGFVPSTLPDQCPFDPPPERSNPAQPLPPCRLLRYPSSPEKERK
jgi:hypothetical protein